MSKIEENNRSKSPVTFKQKSRTMALSSKTKANKSELAYPVGFENDSHKEKGKTRIYKPAKSKTNEPLEKRYAYSEKADEWETVSRATVQFNSKQIQKSPLTSQPDRKKHTPSLFKKPIDKNPKFEDYCNKIKLDLNTQYSAFSDLNIHDVKLKAIFQQMFIEEQEFESLRQKYLHLLLDNERKVFKLKKRVEKHELKELSKQNQKHRKIQHQAFVELSAANNKILKSLKRDLKARSLSKSRKVC
jgi:hypothetical protein